jgi:branched-chain amino acid transport system permease protein
MGLVGIPSPSLFGFEFRSLAAHFYFTAVLVIITAWVSRWLLHSRHGQALVAIREDEVAARVLGIDTGKYKVFAFTISAFFAGLAGAVFAHYMSFIGPSNFTSSESFLILSMAILGGCSIPGSLLGAGVFVLLPEVLRGLANYRLLINGLLLVLFMIFRPGGLIPEPRLTPRKFAEWLGGPYRSGATAEG